MVAGSVSFDRCSRNSENVPERERNCEVEISLFGRELERKVSSKSDNAKVVSP